MSGEYKANINQKCLQETDTASAQSSITSQCQQSLCGYSIQRFTSFYIATTCIPPFGEFAEFVADGQRMICSARNEDFPFGSHLRCARNESLRSIDGSFCGKDARPSPAATADRTGVLRFPSIRGRSRHVTPHPEKQCGAAFGWTTGSTFISRRTLGSVRLLLSTPLVQLRAA